MQHPSEQEVERGTVRPATGEMQARVEAHDWAATPLGPMDAWPQSLRTATGTMLASAFPQVVLWGPHLIQIYNDAYIPFLGVKHPGGLGIPTRECWPEAWAFSAPYYARVLRGEAIAFEDQLYRLERRGPDHPPDDVYITLSYSPIPGESGDVGGILATLIDTTSQVEARRLEAERERLVQALETERARLEDVFLQTPAFIAVLRGETHVFELTNRPYQQMIGHRDVVGLPVRAALPEIEGQGFIELLDRVYQTGEPFTGTETHVRLQREPGAEPEDVFLDFVYQPLREPDGTIAGIIAHGVDVTTQVLARRAMEEANRSKTDFLATMSHELRTPLNAMIGYSDLLLDGIPETVSEPVAASVERIGLSARHLLGLIEEILTYTRVEAGRERVDRAPTDLKRLLDEAAAVAEPLAARKGVDFRVVSPPSAVVVATDVRKVRQILLHLVGNAVKFTEEGSVTLELQASDEVAVFQVADTGQGIAPQHMEDIFEPFFQVETRHSRRVSGTGLGLSVSRRLARLLGGELLAESKPGEGSTFELRLPTTPAPGDTARRPPRP
jgi:signal transduction histidine kinase